MRSGLQALSVGVVAALGLTVGTIGAGGPAGASGGAPSLDLDAFFYTASAQPADGATIFLSERVGGSLRALAATTTNADGEFTFSASDYDFVAQPGDTGTFALTATVGQSALTFDFTATAPGPGGDWEPSFDSLAILQAGVGDTGQTFVSNTSVAGQSEEMDATPPVLEADGSINVAASVQSVADLFANDPSYADMAPGVVTQSLLTVETNLNEINDEGGPALRPAARGGGVSCYVTSTPTWVRSFKFRVIPTFLNYHISSFTTCSGDVPVGCTTAGTVTGGVPPGVIGAGVFNTWSRGCFVDSTSYSSGLRPTFASYTTIVKTRTGVTLTFPRGFLLT